MSNPAAFQATFSDFRVVKGRKVCQWVFETPIEAADAALEALGGIPQPHEERWAAIARIDLKMATIAPPVADIVPIKERRPFLSLPLSQQSALRCNDEDFWKFLNHSCGQAEGINSMEGAATFVRGYCNVISRSDIKPETERGERWVKLNDKYEAWVRDRNYR